MPPRPTPADPVPPELAGLSEYAHPTVLGRGGMGVVYLATHSLMGRQVVLKVMTPAAGGSEGAADRFLQEIRAAAALDHPNVVRAYAAHQVGDRLVFVMEYVPGDDLAKVLHARGRLPVANACYYAFQAAQGLQHAHERGLVHRDVKPGNLILAKVGNRSVVKVTDFGLAKAARERAPDAGLTGDGRLMGTPHYLAPEQALDAARADIRADVYSLGCTLYHLVAGRLPFDARGVVALVDAHRHETAPPLDAVRPGVPPGLAAAVARMMAKEPADRFPTPAEAGRALLPFFKPGGSTEATPVKALPSVAPAPAGQPASHWKPPTLFRGSVVPTDTAYLNAEDFNPAAAPAKAPRRRKAKPFERPLVRRAVLGAVLLALVVVAGLNLSGLVRLRATPLPDEGGPGSDGSGAVAGADGPGRPGGWVSLFDGVGTNGWRADPLHKGSFEARGGVLAVAGGPPPADKGATLPNALAVTDRADFGNVRVRLTYRRTKPEAFCQLALRTPGGEHSVKYAGAYFAAGASVSLGGVTGLGATRPPGSILTRRAGEQVVWTSAPGTNPAGETTLEVELVGDVVRAFGADGGLLLDAHLPGLPATGRLGLWAGAGAGLEVLKLEVKELPPGPAASPGPLVFGDRAPDLPPARRVARDEFDRDSPTFDADGHGARNGCYVITAAKSARGGYGQNVLHLKGDPAVPGDCDFAVEAVARATGSPTAKWGLNFTNWPHPEPNYGVQVRVSADGEVGVLPGSFDNTKRHPGPLAPLARHPAVNTGGGFNKLLVVVRGKELRAYCNGALVCGPVPLLGDLMSPMAVAFTAERATVAELDRVTAWLLGPPAPPAAPPSPPAPAPGFEPLFNGRDRAGWSVPAGADNWRVENGLLVARGGAAGSHLFSDRAFADFHLRAEFRVNAAGNGGLFFRAAPGDAPTGYEAQINPGDTRGPPTGSLYLDRQVVAKATAALGRAGDWCVYEVIARGPAVTLKVDGITTAAFTAPPTAPARGRVALQHLDPKTIIEFRKVEVNELAAPPPAPAKVDPPKLAFAGSWAGDWSNSRGESGKDTLDLAAANEGKYTATWTGYIKLTGRRTGPDAFELTGTHKDLRYTLTGALKAGVLGIKYVVRGPAGKELYTGQSTLRRK